MRTNKKNVGMEGKGSEIIKKEIKGKNKYQKHIVRFTSFHSLSFTHDRDSIPKLDVTRVDCYAVGVHTEVWIMHPLRALPRHRCRDARSELVCINLYVQKPFMSFDSSDRAGPGSGLFIIKNIVLF